MSKAVFLDRDGVLNKTDVRDGKPYAPRSIQNFELTADALQSTHRLAEAGYILIVITNQPDVGNGYVEQSVVEAMNEKLFRELPLNAIKSCFHSQKDDCQCRKPKPGMLLEAFEELEIDPEHSFMVGDRWSDIHAGNAAGCKTIFIDNGYAEKKPENPDHVTASLSGAVDYILTAQK